MKKCLLLFTFYFAYAFSFGQTIPQWKIDEVVNYYSKNNDTTYVVNFFTTFYKPSIEEIPVIKCVVNTFKQFKVKLLFVSLDTKKIYEKGLKAFSTKYKLNKELVWINEANAGFIYSKIDTNWKGVSHGTVIVNFKNEQKHFYKENFTEASFARAIEKAAAPFYYTDRGSWSFDKSLNAFFIAPLVNAEVINPGPVLGNYPDFTHYLFTSTNAVVYSLTLGRVKAVYNVSNGSMSLDIIKDSITYKYINLKKVFVKSCDTIYAGQIIAEAKKGFRYGDTLYEKEKYSLNVNIHSLKNEYIEIPLHFFLKRKMDK